MSPAREKMAGMIRTSKLCPCCGVVKPVAEFHASNRRAGCRVGDGTYIQSKCKACQVLDKAPYRERNRAFLAAEKLRHGCVDCGYKEHAFALDSHHVSEKKFSLASGYALPAAIRALRAEIDKCVVVCAICHRKRHHLRGDSAAQ